MAFQREVAWRVFAKEYNDSDLEIRGEGERAPSYVVTPLGAKANRVMLVGVLTRAEPVNPDSEMWRGQVSDPTGVFHVYAGQYQPEAAAALKELEPPCFVAVVGKTRTYEPGDGRVLVSVTPEVVKEVDSETRDRWVLETAVRTRERLDAVGASADEPNPEPHALKRAGVPGYIADGVAAALPHYGEARADEYTRMVRGALEYLVSGSSSFAADAADPGAQFVPGTDVEAPSAGTNGAEATVVEETATEEAVGEDAEATDAADAADATEAELALEEATLEAIEALDEGKGAPWEEVLERMADEDASETEVEEALNRLMDKGRIYEPILGRLKPS